MDTDADLRKRVKAFKRGGTNRKAKVPKRLLEKGDDVDSLISGHLHTLKDDTWKKQWFVLREETMGNMPVLYTYEASEDASATGTCPLLGYQYSFSVEVQYLQLLLNSSEPRLRDPIPFHEISSNLGHTPSPIWTCIKGPFTNDVSREGEGGGYPN